MARKIWISILLLCHIAFLCAQEPITLTSKGNKSPIVIPAQYSEIEWQAAQQLSDYLKLVFHADYPIRTDDKYKGRHAISIGRTRMAANLYIQYCDSICDDGFLLHTDGQNLYIVGLRENALLYGVSHLMENYFGFLFMDTYESTWKILEGKRKTLAIHDLQNPSFAYREILMRPPLNSQTYADWHKLHTRTYFNSRWGMFVHTFQKLIPIDDYFETHPEWFSEIRGQRVRDGQLCLSNPEVLEELCTNLSSMIAAAPEKSVWSVSQNDNENSCTCAACRHLDSLYGGPSGTMLYFINQVARRFSDKTISTLAYLQTRRPPKNIKPEPNVNIMFCSIECQRQRPIAENPADRSFQRDMEGWVALTDNIFLWDYVVQFKNFLDPFPNLHVLQANLKNFRDHNIKMVFEQGSNNNFVESEEWRAYLLAHLLWNVDIDVDSLRDTFLDAYYGPNRAPYIKQYYDTMTAALLASGQVLDIYGYPMDAKDGYLSPAMIAYYQSLFKQAYEIPPHDYLKGLDYSYYDDRLRCLELPLDFAILDLSLCDVSPELSFFQIDENGNRETNESMLERAKSFKADCKRLGVRKLDEASYQPSQFWDNILRHVNLGTSVNKALGKPVYGDSTWSKTYDVGGSRALTDGKFGTMDYRHHWLGFQGEDMDVTIDLGEETDVEGLSTNFFFFPLSWIYAPVKVTWYLSSDGEHWQEQGTIEYQNGNQLTRRELVPFDFKINPQKARYVRMTAESPKTNPAWHRGYGQPCWIFCDEIVVR
ncbi:MAG: DUF4838 domain-containing protein [Bacteroidales bacterium]|nr:DUF4838 domain-containing protein [Bacteroidales bacterium]